VVQVNSEEQSSLNSKLEKSASQSPDVVSLLSPAPEPQPPLPPHRPSPLKWLLRGVAIGTTAIVSTIVGATAAMMVPLPSAIAPQQEGQISIQNVLHQSLNYQITRPINILVMGIDLPMDLPPGKIPHVFAGRSDTMLLVRLDPTTESVNVLSIPRDTQVLLPDEGIEKINHANVVGGAKFAAQVVSQNLNGVTIDRYVRVSTGAFRELVDLVGGVRVFVPEPMQYEDVTQKLKIDLQEGWQVLGGEQAEQFARFRNDQYGDVGRVQRQQQLLRALREKLTNPAMIARLPQAIQLFNRYIDTNLSSDELLALADFGMGLQQDNFRMVMLPGRFSAPEEFEASYWIADPIAMDQVMHEYFDLSSVAVLSQHHSSTDLRIAIQNASGDPEMGSKMLAYLQDQGFHNAYVVEDWPDFQTETQIIAQRGDLQGASTLGTIMGVGKVISASTGDLESDLTIRVGTDWQQKAGT
jgi:LCP family protein required for cell wall assembly